MPPRPGRVVILNGASSAGKTSLAERVRDERGARGEPWVIMGLDDFLAKLPVAWFEGDGFHGPFSADGIRFEESAGVITVRLGAFGRQLLDGYHHAVAACARQGLNILVDEVAFDEECVRGWGDALRGLPVTWIAVRCDADVAEARELARGDRVPGLARGQSEVVHRWARYDGEVDTTETPLDLVAAQLDAILTSEIRQ